MRSSGRRTPGHPDDCTLAGSGTTLSGGPGRPLSPGCAARSTATACISREFRAFAQGADRPGAEYVRASARRLHDRVGGPGVGVIGRCSSGGFALASAVEPAVLAPVASQPGVPFPVTAGHRRDIGMSEREAAAIGERVRSEGLCQMGLRSSEDAASSRDRFRALRATFGDGWLPVQLTSRPGNEAGIGPNEHRVLASKDVETPGHPTHEAREQVVAFLQERLSVAAAHRA